jgi:hemerythrin-like domain-containing protein
MQVTDELMNEHQFILKYIDLMERYIEFSKTNKCENILLGKAQDFISFFIEFMDTYHHAKEENALFKYLQEPGVLSHCNPLPVMMSDHDNGRMYLRNINSALVTNDPETLCENAYAFSHLLKQHIYKEDNILYPMAEVGISIEDKISLENEYKQIEEKLNKMELWKQYEEKYSELESHLSNKLPVVV